MVHGIPFWTFQYFSTEKKLLKWNKARFVVYKGVNGEFLMESRFA